MLFRSYRLAESLPVIVELLPSAPREMLMVSDVPALVVVTVNCTLTVKFVPGASVTETACERMAERFAVAFVASAVRMCWATLLPETSWTNPVPVLVPVPLPPFADVNWEGAEFGRYDSKLSEKVRVGRSR